MKREMSANQSDNITCIMVGMAAGIVKYLNIVKLNIGLLSGEFLSILLHTAITAGMAGAMGWAGKKVAEIMYSNITEYIQSRKRKKRKP